jgi:SAM-dependent methyltransferase/uncharacterized protein YbaR (Trm112 family)
VRRSHFSAFAPHCPSCAAKAALGLSYVGAERGDDVLAGILVCGNPACRHEYPILDGIPVIVPTLGPLLAERGVELLLRDDLDPLLESVFGDAIGAGTWFDVLRQTVSTYAWDGWADFDPGEAATASGPHPGAARRCLARLEYLAGDGAAGKIFDLGCGVGRTSFDLAERHPDALVLGVDIGLALLRLARGALAGRVSYARRRIGLVYDRRSFPVAAPGGRVDFWGCDAAALPFAAGSADLVAALNLLDCVAAPAHLLTAMADLLRPGGRLLLATPYDWSTRATQPESWIGGHSQRGPDGGAGEPFLRALLTEGAHRQSVAGLRLLGEDTDFPWQTRLHDRSFVQYATHLVALQKSTA